MEHNANKRNSFAQTDLTIPCKTGNVLVSVVSAILEWRDDDGEILDISVRDENGQTALSFHNLSNNAEIVATIEQKLFLKAVENGDTDTVKNYLSPKESNPEQIEIQYREEDLIEDLPPNRFKGGLEAQFTSTDSITSSVWFEAVAIAQRKYHAEMLNLLFNDQRFIHGFNTDGQTILHQVVGDYLQIECKDFNHHSIKVKTIEILLKSWTFNSNILNLHNETIFEIICKLKPGEYCNINDFLQFLFQNGFDLNGRNKNGETFLMLACKNRRMDIVEGLLELALREFVLDINAVDNSGETAEMKVKEKEFHEIVVAFLKFKLMSAVKDKNIDNVKSMLSELRNRNASDIFVKSWSSNEGLRYRLIYRETKSTIWLETMHIAMENDTKPSEEILALLLDCDILLNPEMETGYSSFYQFMYERQVDHVKKLRLIEMLLKSGKIKVNDRDNYARTVLHWANEKKLISLLIDYGADFSRKDIEGKTPLMPISSSRGIDRCPVWEKLLEDPAALVHLDAIDCNGRTALMYAVRRHCSYHVELLLNKGASVNLSDHLGFTALHHALHEDIDKHFDFPRNSEDLEKIKEIFDTEKHEHRVWGNDEWSEERRKIVDILLQRPDIDVNLKSIEMLSPLDIVELQIPEISPSIKDALKEKGAILNLYRQTESQSTRDFHPDIRCKLTKEFHLDFEFKLPLKQLFKAVDGLNTENLNLLKERWLSLFATFKEQLVSGKDEKGRTAFHLVASSFYKLTQRYRSTRTHQSNSDCKMDLAKTIVNDLVSLGCSVNETDNFGRTPLDYADKMFLDLIISKGANASIKDKDGNIAKIKTPIHFSHETSNKVYEIIGRNNETYILRLTNNKQMEINVQYVDDSNDDSVPEFSREDVNLESAPESVPRFIWKNSEFACRHPLVKEIAKEVRDLVDAIAKEIERLDPRFKIEPELVGSSNEETRLDKPDEFDFCFVLTKISELCEVSQSPELPTGFVHIKRKQKRVGETSHFERFFGKDGMLNTETLNCQFTTLLRNAVVNIDNQESFEWILDLPIQHKGRTYDHVKKVLNIKMTNPINFFTLKLISVDIVPCIHVDGWWPDESISNVSDEIQKLIKKFGCNLIFDRPQELYPWVPYSDFCARISFSKAESEMIKQSCDNAREAYMIGKKMVEQYNLWVIQELSKYTLKNCENAREAHMIGMAVIDHRECLCQYALKNCLLYCIEALKPNVEKASQLGLSLEEMDSKFHQMDRYLWLKCLMKCLFEFVAQDFCPCYLMPTFSSFSLTKKGHYLKKVSFDWLACNPSTFLLSCKNACALYRCTSNDISECSYQLPAPDPLWERFDRKRLIASLCEIAYK